MPEIWLQNNELIPAKEWDKVIENLKSEKKKFIKSDAERLLKEKFISSIKERMPNKKFGIFFSGGVDSTFIAAVCNRLNADFTCYTVGFQEDTKEPEDISEAKKVAEELNIDLKSKIYNLEEARKIIVKTVDVLKKVNKTDVVNVGVGAVVLACIELAKEDGIDFFFSGLGSEEIFAGYERHGKVHDVNEECWHGLREMWGRDLVRDFNLAKELGVEIKTPFLDSELIKFVMQLPDEWKIDDKRKKIILREVAEEFLGEFAWRKKKAAQYGSCFDKAISKLARQDGFKMKGEWLAKKVESS